MTYQVPEIDQKILDQAGIAQEALRTLGDRDSDLAHFLRQARRDATQPILHLRSSDIQVGTGQKGDRDFGGAVRPTGRRHTSASRPGAESLELPASVA